MQHPLESARMQDTREKSTEEDYSNKWRVMLAVAMGVFLATLDGSIVNIAMPVMQKALHTDFAMVQWVVLSYLLVVTTLMLGMGRLGDMIGKKSIYASGFVVFTLGSALCGFAPDVEMLIVFRSFQGVGAAMLMALGAAIVTEAFPSYERGQALGVIGTLVSIGVVAGPVLGGIILAHFSWHWIFFVNIPVGVVGTWMVVKFIPAHKPRGGQKFDYPGALSLFVSLISLLMGLTMGQRIGFGDQRILSLFAIWVIFLLMFLYIEVKSHEPMLDLRIFLNGHLSINVITGFTTFFSIAGLFILIPFYLEDILEYDTRTTGLLMSVVPIAMGVIAPRAGKLSDKWGTRPLTMIGLAILALGYLSASTLGRDTTAPGYLIRFLPIGIGMGLFQSPNNSAIMGSVPRNQLGVASGLLSVTRTLGQTVGVAVLGTIWSASVFLHSGPDFHDTPTRAPLDAQVDGLKHTLLIVTGIIALALILSVWAAEKHRKGSKKPILSGDQ